MLTVGHTEVTARSRWLHMAHAAHCNLAAGFSSGVVAGCLGEGQLPPPLNFGLLENRQSFVEKLSSIWG